MGSNPIAPEAFTLAGRVLAMMDLARTGEVVFVGRRVAMGLPQVFGGQVLAQGLVAAGCTITGDKTAHSLHAYSPRASEPGQPIQYRIERIRDARRLSLRQVTVVQHGRPILTVRVSLAPTWPRLIESDQSTDQIWQHVPFCLPAEQLELQAFVLYASDITILTASLVPHGALVGCGEIPGRRWNGLSGDHPVWLHRYARPSTLANIAAEVKLASDTGRAPTGSRPSQAGSEIEG